ncbi:MAG TPA: hydrogenase membrane subunit [Methanoregula sp.]|nr:hydrogenase membrane subunit [Methanoregula sp.]
MIILLFFAVAALTMAGVLISRNQRQMNTVCIAQSVAFAFLALGILFTGQVPVSVLQIGSPYFFIDHLGLFEVLISTTIFTFAALYARGYVEGLLTSGELEKGGLRLFYIAWAALLTAIVFSFFSDNLALFWIFAELTTVISALLVAILAARENIDAAIKYIFIASTSMLFSFIGFIFFFETARAVTGTGTLNWTELLATAHAFPPFMATAAFVLVFIGFAAKSGIFPFHTWLPEAHAKAPSAVSAVLSGVLLNVGIYGIIRAYALVHQTDSGTTASFILALFGVLTIGIAAFSMIPERNLKKLIAFSSIENMGILLVGLAVATPVALFFVLFHIMAHSLTKASLFFSAGILHRQYKSPLSSEAVDDIRDVFTFQPLAAWGVIIGGIAIIGMPPFPIFISKFFLMLQVGTVSPLVLAVVLVLLFIATVALGYFVITMFSKRSDPGRDAELVPYKTPASMQVPVIVLLVLLLIMGIIFTRGEVSFITSIITELRFA